MGRPERAASLYGVGRGMADGWEALGLPLPDTSWMVRAVAAGEVHGVDRVAMIGPFVSYRAFRVQDILVGVTGNIELHVSRLSRGRGNSRTAGYSRYGSRLRIANLCGYKPR